MRWFRQFLFPERGTSLQLVCVCVCVSLITIRRRVCVRVIQTSPKNTKSQAVCLCCLPITASSVVFIASTQTFFIVNDNVVLQMKVVAQTGWRFSEFVLTRVAFHFQTHFSLFALRYKGDGGITSSIPSQASLASSVSLDLFDPLPTSTSITTNPTRKTPESFLGPNAALVNLDSLVTKPAQPAPVVNPFLASAGEEDRKRWWSCWWT